jgi:hypothetical protein
LVIGKKRLQVLLCEYTVKDQWCKRLMKVAIMSNEQDGNTGSSPWQAVLEQCLGEFMQFFFPAAWAEIDWQHPARVLPIPLPQPVVESTHSPLQQVVAVQLRSGQSCRLYIYLGWADEERQFLAQHIYQIQCSLYSASPEALACFVVAGGTQGERQSNASFARECLGNQLGMYFPCVYFTDFLGQEAALFDDDNAFAMLTLIHLVRLQTGLDMTRRYHAKWELLQSMFVRGWSRDRIIVLFLALDWSLPLPLRLSAHLWREIEQFEEQQIMRYVSSVERFIREREWQQGFQQGESIMLQHLLVQRFGPLPLWVGMQIAGGSSEQRLHWQQRVLEASNLEDVFHEANELAGQAQF